MEKNEESSWLNEEKNLDRVKKMTFDWVGVMYSRAVSLDTNNH